ncbi:unnamed protein product, partial [Brassica rapa subsp. trilocularis]
QHLRILGTHGTSNEHSASTRTTNTHIISICVSVAQTQESLLLFSSHQYLLDQSNTSKKEPAAKHWNTRQQKPNRI